MCRRETVILFLLYQCLYVIVQCLWGFLRWYRYHKPFVHRIGYIRGGHHDHRVPVEFGRCVANGSKHVNIGKPVGVSDHFGGLHHGAKIGELHASHQPFGYSVGRHNGGTGYLYARTLQNVIKLTQKSRITISDKILFAF